MPSSDEKLQKVAAETVSGDEMSNFDGFYFVPDYDDFDGNYKLAFFNFKEECILYIFSTLTLYLNN